MQSNLDCEPMQNISSFHIDAGACCAATNVYSQSAKNMAVLLSIARFFNRFDNDIISLIPCGTFKYHIYSTKTNPSGEDVNRLGWQESTTLKISTFLSTRWFGSLEFGGWWGTRWSRTAFRRPKRALFVLVTSMPAWYGHWIIYLRLSEIWWITQFILRSGSGLISLGLISMAG